MTCIDLPSKRSIMLSLVPKHSKQRKTTKPIKCNELHRLDVKTIKTKLNYKSDQNPMTCIDLTSKRSKMLSYVAKHSKQPKTTKPIKCNELDRYDVRTIKTKLNYKSDLNYKPIKCNESHRLDVKTIKTKLNYKSDQNPMTCIDLTSKRSIMLSLVSKHSKQRKTTKPIKLQWIASIGCQNNQNKAKVQKWSKLQKWSKSNDLHRFDVKTIKNVELRRKTFKTTQNYKTHQMQWIASIGCQNDQNKAKLQKWSILQKWSKSNDLHGFDVKTIKNVELRRKTFKTTQNYKTHQMQWIASIGCKNDQNKAKLQKWSKSNDLHRFDVKTIKNVELRRKTFKTTQNYKTDQITMNCIDTMSKLSKQSKTAKVINIQWLASIWPQNDQ